MRTLLLCLLVACATEPTAETTIAEQTLGASRTKLSGDIYHYEFIIPVGDTPNANLHIHRVVRERKPWQPRKTDEVIALMHGDFQSFSTSFLPGVAPWLAARDVDVWGIDRRWAHATVISDFNSMGLDEELADTGVALAFIRGVRLVEGSGSDRVKLAGFSRGGQLTYFYASREALRPAPLRHVDGIVPLDVYASLADDDTDTRQFYCDTAAWEYDQLAQGVAEVSNDFQISVGQAAIDAPAAQSEWIPRFNNRQMMLWLLAKTYFVFPAQPNYHLMAPTFDANGDANGLRLSPESAAATWLASSPLFQPMRESADTDGIMCGDTSFDVPLSRIQVPLLSIAAAGGYGERTLHSTSSVGSSDVTAIVIRQLPVEREREDYGHADLLFAPDAAQTTWQPLLTWLRAH
jgi:pimeloyl-ACP methyl ester carboxylesterase